MVITSKSEEKEKAEVLKKIYELGFEVGLKNHSEIGWVLREYNDLVDRASKLGVKTPDSYYADGKIKGKASKDNKNIEAAKIPKKEPPAVKKVIANDTVVELPNIRKEERGFDRRLEQPSFNEMPKLVEKGSATELPSFLEGFRPNKRK